MRNIIFLLSVFIAIIFFPGCNTIQKIDSTKLNVMDISELISGQAKLVEVINSIKNGNTHVFKISKGQQVPLKININLPVMNIQPVKNNIVFTRDTYLMISKSEMKISPDGQEWANIQDVASIKKLYEINKQGQISVGYGLEKNEGAFFSLDIKTEPNL